MDESRRASAVDLPSWFDHPGWAGPFQREPEHDMPDAPYPIAYRSLTPCDETCHHPVHGFKQPRGSLHLSWFTAEEACDLAREGSTR